MQKHRYREIPLCVEYGLAGVFEIRVDLFLGEVEGVCPGEGTGFVGVQLTDAAVVALLELAVGEAGIQH